MEVIVKNYQFYNCDIEIIEGIYRDKITGEVVGNSYTYRINYPGEIEVCCDDKLRWYSINDALDAGISDVCDDDKAMIREMKLRIVFDEI
jgi:hypothetical protein